MQPDAGSNQMQQPMQGLPLGAGSDLTGVIARNSFRGNAPYTQNREASSPMEYDIGKDLWQQLQRVSIPVFNGNKAAYESWTAAFNACIDKAPATPEYKLLQLRQHLSGEALKCVENLGYSKTAYEAAKNRLQRKYGGTRRRIALFVEELENLKPIRAGSAQDIEVFADLLDIAVINLKDTGRFEELGNGSLYVKIQKKLPEQMLANFHRWVYENNLTESVEALRTWVIQEAEYQVIASETIRGVLPISTIQKREPYRGYFADKEAPAKKTCKECWADHEIWNCETFKKMDVDQRWKRATDLKLCYCCLNNGHIGQVCTWRRKCDINNCKSHHNRLLHDEKLGTPKEKTENASYKSIVKEEKGKNQLSMRTIPVVLRNGSLSMIVNALLDDGSTKTFVNSDVIEQLNGSGISESIEVSVLNDKKASLETMSVSLELQNLQGTLILPITVFSTEKVTGNLKAVDWNKHKHRWNHLRSINFPKLAENSLVDMLIGLDYSQVHASIKEVIGKPGNPVARLTPLGWTCVGHTDGQGSIATNFSRTYFVKHDPLHQIETTLKKFWEMESVSTQNNVNNMSREEEMAQSIVKESLQFKDGHYEVAMPWKTGTPALPNSFNMALKRLQFTERKLRKNSEAEEAYKGIIQEYEEKGYIRRVNEDVYTQSSWYLPHFAVIRMDKATTKTRIVFDASAKDRGVSLNDVILPGPNLQRNLFSVLLRFRRFPIAIVCDIKEMYLQIGVQEKDRSYLRFLWRNMNESVKPTIYEFNRVVFGVTSSPFQAQFVIRSHANSYKHLYPRAAETVLESTYMDDSMDSVSTEQEGKELYMQLYNLWRKCGMHARKWLSNSITVIKGIPAEDRADKINIEENHLPSIKTLGIYWTAATDEFVFKAMDIEKEFVYTKRNFLKKIATIFDPLGFLAPFIIRGKIIMQSIWESGADWDEQLDNEITRNIMSWFSELPDLEQLRIPRCIRLKEENVERSITLHGFCDASEDAMGAVIYVVCSYQSGQFTSRLIASKTKVAPLVSVSIPRLELMSAVLCLRLALSVARTLKISSEKIMYWSDNMNVIYWIQSASRRYKTFIANRVGEIQAHSSPADWRHVPGNINPADVLTRGIEAKLLVDNYLWWNGPTFLVKEKEEWPQKVCQERQLKYDLELKRVAVESTFFQKATLSTHMATSKTNEWRLEVTRFSNWKRITRIVAWIFRWCNNCRTKELRLTGELMAEEVKESETWLIRNAQKENFLDEYTTLSTKKEISRTSRLLCLHPILDEDGIMRCDGRLTNARFLSFDSRYPIILPRKSWITHLIIFQRHMDDNHNSGTNQLLSALSSRYWIISAREAIREVENGCFECRRRKRKAATQVMAPLPSYRLKTPIRAFTYSAVDYGGPFLTKQGRCRKRTKRYLCLFTCLHSRAVHLEMAYSLDTDSFLNAFYRMVNRRGLPRKMLSDNGGNFVGANRELKELVKQIDQQRIIAATANKGVEWQFNPPLTPHFGGAFEIMIKSAKRAIRAILGNADINDEELVTSFTGAENLINSRPLTYQSSHPSDMTPITPNHFLHGQVGGEFAPESVDTTLFNPKKRWRRVQELVRHCWHRWLKEWLPSISRRQKWHKTYRDIRKDDVVLMMSTDLPRGKWPLGRILEVYPGSDKHVRVVKVKVNGQEYVRSIQKLIPLECSDRDIVDLRLNRGEEENVSETREMQTPT